MKFSEKWLREWIDPPLDTRQLAHQITMAGLEVDAIEAVAPAFDNVVVGHVLALERHPDADKLNVCRVDAGKGQQLQIVCGAANVRVGMRVPLALVGATLPGGLSIKKAKLRGVESSGMLCSAKELGLAETSSGLLELPADAEVGQSVRDCLHLDDVSIELGLTPNRSDCLSVLGIAREVAALNKLALRPHVHADVPAQIHGGLAVQVVAPDLCPRYVGRLIQGVDTQAKTPLWMQERLRRSGLRSLGPVVDVTNYVLLELGQPMHAFDAAKLNGGIVVRTAREGERLTLLNGQEIALRAGSLIIADQHAPQALAGVMGGAASAVTVTTRDIFLESAHFATAAMAGTARSYGLHTDSSHRFERGVDPDLQRRAIERATALIVEIAGGTVGTVVEVMSPKHLPVRAPIVLRAMRIQKVLGMSPSREEIGDILVRLGMKVEGQSDGWRIEPPSFRFDMEREVDLIEDIARIYGYDRLPVTKPSIRGDMLPAPEAGVDLQCHRQLLVERGYQEAITYSFVAPQMQDMFANGLSPIPLTNPISEDLSVMRTSLWPGLVQAAAYNTHRQQDRVQIFESGLRFYKQDTEIQQEAMLAGLVCGTAFTHQWALAPRAVDFFDVKADIEALLAVTAQAADFTFVAAQHPALHPGQSARIYRGNKACGWVGLMRPDLQKQLDFPAPVVLFELELGAILRRKVPKFSEISKFPAIWRDVAIVIDQAVTAHQVRDCVKKYSPDTLKNFQLFDVYQGKGIDSGRKSVAFRLTLQAQLRTLDDQEIDAAIAAIVAALKTDLGATLRE